MEDESLKKKEKTIKLNSWSPNFLLQSFHHGATKKKKNQICFSFCLGNEKKKKLYLSMLRML